MTDKNLTYSMYDTAVQAINSNNRSSELEQRQKTLEMYAKYLEQADIEKKQAKFHFVAALATLVTGVAAPVLENNYALASGFLKSMSTASPEGAKMYNLLKQSDVTKISGLMKVLETAIRTIERHQRTDEETISRINQSFTKIFEYLRI